MDRHCGRTTADYYVSGTRMSDVQKLYFVHEGKAAYPELDAYKKFLAQSFAREDVTQEQAASRSDIAHSVCWHMMGFYPRRLPARLVIHDYRSLSVGRLRQLKDLMKRLFNAKPDIRIFQNTTVQKALGFNDKVPTILLPMGVPDFIAQHRATVKAVPEVDYCYIGAMSAERRSHVMIDSFLKRFGSSKTLVLYGNPEPYLIERYRGHGNVQFAGNIPQAQLFDKLTRAGACVCYFPNHYPHLLQTPTKMLEYAALGLKIIANTQPISVATAKQYGINCQWGPSDDMFAGAPDLIDWPGNEALDPSEILWSTVIKRSGIAELIASQMAAKRAGH